MFNLIRRDVIILKHQLFFLFPIIIFFILRDSPPTMLFFLASMFIPFNALANDERTDVNILLNSLPYTRKEIISSRYLGSIIYMLIAIGITSLAFFVFNKPFTITEMVMGGSLFLAFAAFTFPCFYLLKPGYVTTFALISFFLFAGAGPRVVKYVADKLPGIIDFIDQVSVTVLYAGTAIIIMLLYTISWMVSTIIYQRKVF